MHDFQVGQLVTVSKRNDAFFNIVGRIISKNNGCVRLDMKFTKRTYRYSEVMPICEGQAR